MENSNGKTLSGRREFLFLYDIKMGNPNGDTDENRPRVLPDGTVYVTDVRLKRFVRDFLKMKGLDILVDTIEGKTTNLTGRVVHYLNAHQLKRVEGKELVNILLDAFIDARIFGSSFAFKAEKLQEEPGTDTESKKPKTEEPKWEPKPEPKTMTGAVQFNMGEVLHPVEFVDIHGTTTFGSDESKGQGTFTAYYGVRYALIGFSGVGNEHSAAVSRMSDQDYDRLLPALWHGVRASANTRTKVGQIPHLLLSIEYVPGEEFQFGRLQDYVTVTAAHGKEAKTWSSPADYQVDLTTLFDRVQAQSQRIAQIRYAVSADISLLKPIPTDGKWIEMPIEDLWKADA